MHNYSEILCKKSLLILKAEPFTEREALYWLVTKSIDGKLACTIRDIDSIWKWNKSKVEAMLNKDIYQY